MWDIHFCDRFNESIDARTDIEFHDHQTQISIDSIYKKTRFFRFENEQRQRNLIRGKSIR